MTTPPLQIRWITLPHWTKSGLIGFDDIAGLIRFLDRKTIVYIGMETVSLSHVRRFATPGGSAQRHPGGREIYARRHELTLQYAILHAPRSEIERVRNALILKHRPRFNFEELESN